MRSLPLVPKYHSLRLDLTKASPAWSNEFPHAHYLDLFYYLILSIRISSLLSKDEIDFDKAEAGATYSSLQDYITSTSRSTRHDFCHDLLQSLLRQRKQLVCALLILYIIPAMSINKIYIPNQRHGAAEIALGHLLQSHLLLFFRIDIYHLLFLASSLFKGYENLILRDCERVDEYVLVGCLLWNEHRVLDR